jgi:hypothetical protein
MTSNLQPTRSKGISETILADCKHFRIRKLNIKKEKRSYLNLRI